MTEHNIIVASNRKHEDEHGRHRSSLPKDGTGDLVTKNFLTKRASCRALFSVKQRRVCVEA